MAVDDAATILTGEERPGSGSLSAAISKAVVQLMRDLTGRGPTKVRTSIRDNIVLVILEDILTKGEQSLLGAGRVEQVLELRHEFQMAMREQAIEQVSALTGRTVVAMMSANHVDPDLAAEIFVLDGSVAELPEHD